MPEATISSCFIGVEVPIPIYPLFPIMKFVAVDEPTTNAGAVPIPFGFTERSPHADDDAIPTFPPELTYTFGELLVISWMSPASAFPIRKFDPELYAVP